MRVLTECATFVRSWLRIIFAVAEGLVDVGLKRNTEFLNKLFRLVHGLIQRPAGRLHLGEECLEILSFGVQGFLFGFADFLRSKSAITAT